MAAFPNMTREQITAFIVGLFDLNSSPEQVCAQHDLNVVKTVDNHRNHLITFNHTFFNH